MAKPATAKTAALPSVSIVRLSPEAPGDAGTAAILVPGGVAKAGIVK
jgi:hypothetical protein|tara:strand:- start:1192 stop:1332 length:141 start_codon:yes stop_codon:yes gene_type:complete